MTPEQADRVRMGDSVMHNGHPHRVNSVKLHGVGGPYFRLSTIGQPADCDNHGDPLSFRLLAYLDPLAQP